MDLKTLCELNGISGQERDVRAAVFAAAEAVCERVSIDRMGNVLATKTGSAQGAPHVLLAAHMDEVGLIVLGATDDGLLRVRPVGGVDPRVVISKRVVVGRKAIPGVIGAMAIHLQTPEDRARVLDYDGIYVDIGAKDKGEAESLCPLGSAVHFDTKFEPFGAGLARGKALDDRVGVWNLLRVLAETYPCTVTCAFNTGEEVGCRGAIGSAWTVAPDYGIVLEGTTANDMGDVPETQRVCRVGEGVAVSFMDNASIANRTFFRQALEIARAEGVAHQLKNAVAGGNDAGAIQRSRAGVRTLVLSVPCRYIHSPVTVASLSDIDAQLQLTQAILRRLS